MQYKILHEKGAEFRRLQREGVLAGDIIQGMIRKDARYMVTGALDADLVQHFRLAYIIGKNSGVCLTYRSG